MDKKYYKKNLEMAITGIKNHVHNKYLGRANIIFEDWYLSVKYNEIVLHMPYLINKREREEFSIYLY